MYVVSRKNNELSHAQNPRWFSIVYCRIKAEKSACGGVVIEFGEQSVSRATFGYIRNTHTQHAPVHYFIR